MSDILDRAARRRRRQTDKQALRKDTSNSLTTTVVTVLLTFFLTTVGGGLLSFWARLNENETAAAQLEIQNGLEAYGQFLENIVPELERSQQIGFEILKYGERRPGKDIYKYAVGKTDQLPDVSGLSDNGAIDLYLGREAGIGLHALTGQYLAMRVMIERNAASGKFPATSFEVSKYLTEIRVSYSVYLLNILKCKQRVTKTFMLWGKLAAMEECERPPESILKQWNIEIWEPGIFSTR